uniref:Uncharacterized protein n=1 Tax=Anguilla anguilla TaxID=7936 RepID=A0A0E9P973_ANGAN
MTFKSIVQVNLSFQNTRFHIRMHQCNVTLLSVLHCRLTLTFLKFKQM